MTVAESVYNTNRIGGFMYKRIVDLLYTSKLSSLGHGIILTF